MCERITRLIQAILLLRSAWRVAALVIGAEASGASALRRKLQAIMSFGHPKASLSSLRCDRQAFSSLKPRAVSGSKSQIGPIARVDRFCALCRCTTYWRRPLAGNFDIFSTNESYCRPVDLIHSHADRHDLHDPLNLPPSLDIDRPGPDSNVVFTQRAAPAIARRGLGLSPWFELHVASVRLCRQRSKTRRRDSIATDSSHQKLCNA